MKRNLLLTAALAVVLVLAGCASDITGVTLPEAGNIAGIWNGTGAWAGLQGGGSLGPQSNGTAVATIFQNGAAILSGTTWEVTGIYTGTLTGSIDPDGNATGTATVFVLATSCAASAAWGGKVEGDHLRISTSFAQPGALPCADAPVGLTLDLNR